MSHMVIPNTCSLLLLAINKICSIYGRTGCLFHSIVDTEDIALFYFFYEWHNDLLLEPKTKQNKKKQVPCFWARPRRSRDGQDGGAENKRIQKRGNFPALFFYPSFYFCLTGIFIYLFSMRSFPDSSITVQILALMPGRVPVVASQNNVAGWDAQRRRGEKSSI